MAGTGYLSVHLALSEAEMQRCLSWDLLPKWLLACALHAEKNQLQMKTYI